MRITIAKAILGAGIATSPVWIGILAFAAWAWIGSIAALLAVAAGIWALWYLFAGFCAAVRMGCCAEVHEEDDGWNSGAIEGHNVYQLPIKGRVS